MGVLKKLGDFFFGWDPEIFNEKGQVLHKHPEEKWKNWKDRFSGNPEYDWRQHTGKSHIAPGQQRIGTNREHAKK